MKNRKEDEMDVERGRQSSKRDSKRKRDDNSGSPEPRKQSRADQPEKAQEGGGLREMGVNEMNALRSKLGLKPLSIDPDSSNKDSQKPVKVEPAVVVDVEDKIAMIKERREKREMEKVQKCKTLGDSDSEGDDAMSWILKSKRQKELKEQEAASKRLLSRFEESDDDSSDSDDPVALRRLRAQKKAKAQKGKTQVKREEEDEDAELILGHSFNDLDFGRGEYLTLADKPILKAVGSDQYDIDDEEDEIENIALREKEKRRHNAEVKAGKGKYNAYDEDNPEDDILAKYNEDHEKPKKSAIKIKGGIVQDEQDKVAEIRRKIAESARSMETVSGQFQVTEASDFYSKEEIAQFRKNRTQKTKKGKRKTTLADEIIKPENHNPESELGSSALRQDKKKEANLKEIMDSLEKKSKYQEAIERKNEESKWAFQNDDVDEDESLYQSLAKARNFTQKRKKEFEEAIAHSVDSVGMDIEVDRKVGLVLDENTDFTNSVPTQAQLDEEDSIAAALKRKAMNKRKAMDLLDKVVPVSTTKRAVDKTVVESEMEEEKPAEDIATMLVGDVPLVNKGLAATLEFLRKRGGTDIKDQAAVRSRPADVHIEVDNTDDVIIEYRDERGRILSTKQSFREQSYRFHGKAPGKKKIAKQLRREEEDIRRKENVSDGILDQRLDTFKKTQVDSALPYVVMQGNTSKMLEQRQRITENIQEKQLEKSINKSKST
jgi:U4/U6.U5 tri-snRNP-associated protein 1